ncbi:MAG: hypothetical protein WAV41_04160 [Microgenomates group bacterium]
MENHPKPNLLKLVVSESERLGQYWITPDGSNVSVVVAAKGGQLPADSIFIASGQEYEDFKQALEQTNGDWNQARKMFYGVSEQNEPAPIADWLVKK